MEIKVYRCYNGSKMDPHFVVVTCYETSLRYKSFNSKTKKTYTNCFSYGLKLNEDSIWEKVC